jgi:hypothetical protein
MALMSAKDRGCLFKSWLSGQKIGRLYLYLARRSIAFLRAIFLVFLEFATWLARFLAGAAERGLSPALVIVNQQLSRKQCFREFLPGPSLLAEVRALYVPYI